MIPSLLQIPSAVSNSKLHSVLPNNGKGDFQFDRSTGATRINRDGLIEEVGYFSSELVQNGNFSELGAEQIINGGFEGNANNWTLEAGITYGNNNIVFNSVSNQKAIQTQSFVVGKTYKVSIELQEYTSGTITVRMGSVPQVLSTTIGVQTWYIVATGNLARIEGTFGVGVKATLSNVSVKQVDPNDRWTLTGTATLGNNKVNINSPSGESAEIYQSSILEIGKNYKLKCTLNKTSGDTQFVNGGTFILNDGFNIINFVATDTRVFFKRGAGSVISSLTNISIVEVQGDRPRLSYDITNGVVEDTPHLLLEPSSTNLVTFSEDYTQWTSSLSPTVTSNFAISLEGITNADKITASSNTSSKYIGITLATSTVHTASVFLKNIDSTQSRLEVYASSYAYPNFEISWNGYIPSTLSSNNVSNIQYQEYTNNWWRVSYQFTTDSSITSYNTYIYPDRVNASKSILAFGSQLEQQSYATSYIPTAGTTITRAAETCNNSKPSVNSTEGVFYAEIQALASDSTAKEITINGGNTSNRIVISFNTSNLLRADYTASSSLQARFNRSINIEQFNKIAFAYAVNDFKLYINGVLSGTDTSGSVISAGTLTTT